MDKYAIEEYTALHFCTVWQAFCKLQLGCVIDREFRFLISCVGSTSTTAHAEAQRADLEM